MAKNLKSWMYRKTQGTCPSKVATVAGCPGHEYEHELYEKIHWVWLRQANIFSVRKIDRP